MKRTFFPTVVIAFLLCIFVPTQTVHADTAYYTVTPKVTQAVEDYLNEIYIEKYPEMGLEFTTGTERDKQVLMTLADIVTEGCNTDAEKAMAIAQWVDRNIAYQSLTGETWYLAIDVFHERVGNCVGTAQLMSQLMRLEGIPALMCSGYRGDMVNVMTIENTPGVGHSWVMAYIEDEWQLYDTLFDEYALTDKDYISKWYFTDDMEGVSPYYEGMDTKLMYEGHAIYYIDGRFMNYRFGHPAFGYFGHGSQGGKMIDDAVSYFAESKIDVKGGLQDGFYYVSNPERKDSMINDECYTNGWINYDTLCYYLARPNGTLVSNTVREMNGDYYYLRLGGGALRIEESPNNRTLTAGIITIHPGESIRFDPTFIEGQIAKDRIICWYNETPDVISLAEDGTITAKKEGFASVIVQSKDAVDDDTHYGMASIPLFIKEEGYRSTPNYEDDPVIKSLEDCTLTLEEDTFTYDGSQKTPNVTITRNDGTVLTPGKDYAINYFNNIYPGTATVSIQGSGHYIGSLTASFTIKSINIEDFTFSFEKESFAYTGEEILPEFTLINSDGVKLRANIDYIVTGFNNRSPGTATIEIQGIGTYIGSRTETFIIIPTDDKEILEQKPHMSIEDCTLSMDSKSFAYTGQEILPDVSLTNSNGKKLILGVDYLVTGFNNWLPGTATIEIQGIGAYIGTRTETFTIMPADNEDSPEDLPEEDQACTHAEKIIPGKAATCTSSGLTKGKQCKTCGVITVKQKTIPAKGHAKKTTTTKATKTKNGKVVTKCKTCSKVLSSKTIFHAKTVKLKTSEFIYNGKVKSPAIIIKDSKGKTISSSNYTVTKPSGRKNVGKYTYTIKFKNQYSGTINLTMKIAPKSATMKKPVAAKKAFTVKWNKVSAQATGYEILYSTNKNFTKKTSKTVTVKSYKTTSKKISSLKAKKTYYVKVRTYKTVNGKKYYSTWSKTQSVRTK